MGFETAMLVDIILAGAGAGADAHHHEASTLPFKIALIGALGIWGYLRQQLFKNASKCCAWTRKSTLAMSIDR